MLLKDPPGWPDAAAVTILMMSRLTCEAICCKVYPVAIFLILFYYKYNEFCGPDLYKKKFIMNLSLSFSHRNHDISVRIVKQSGAGNSVPDFLCYLSSYMEYLEKEGRYSSFRAARALNKKLYRFRKTSALPVTEITPAFVKQFEEFLVYKVGNSHNTVTECIKMFGKMVNEIYSSNEILDERDNPFNKIHLIRKQTERSYLSEDEINRIMSLHLKKNTPLWHSRNLFFLECYTGLRIGDILSLRWENYDGHTLTLTMHKTSKRISVPLTHKVVILLESYRDLFCTPDKFIFPFLKIHDTSFALGKAICSATGIVNGHLKVLAHRCGIEKNLSSHTGRHSFATMLVTKGASIYDVKELLGHSDVKVTQIYARITEERKESAISLLE